VCIHAHHLCATTALCPLDRTPRPRGPKAAESSRSLFQGFAASLHSQEAVTWLLRAHMAFADTPVSLPPRPAPRVRLRCTAALRAPPRARLQLPRDVNGVLDVMSARAKLLHKGVSLAGVCSRLGGALPRGTRCATMGGRGGGLAALFLAYPGVRRGPAAVQRRTDGAEPACPHRQVSLQLPFEKRCVEPLARLLELCNGHRGPRSSAITRRPALEAVAHVQRAMVRAMVEAVIPLRLKVRSQAGGWGAVPSAPLAPVRPPAPLPVTS